jgi:hypothetical protein
VNPLGVVAWSLCPIMDRPASSNASAIERWQLALQ